MIKCIAVDDEPLALEQLTGYIARVPFLQLIASCQDAFSAMQVLSEEEVDLMFVDIHMPDLNGLDLVRSLVVKPLIVFTTAYPEYAVEGFKVDAVDYLLKPFDPEKLCRILSTIQFRQSQNSRYIELISDRTPVKIPVRSILYVDTYRNAVQVHTTDAGIIRSYITFQKFEELLEGMKCFLSCYRGCIVNMDHIEKSTDEGFVMDNQELVTVRKRGSNAIKKAYLEYLFSSDSDK